jgi:hypothetical protein
MVMGAAVAGISSALWSAAIPDTSRSNPEHASKQELNERRYVQERRNQELRYKLREGVDAGLADRARPAEVRNVADDVARKLFGKAP